MSITESCKAAIATNASNHYPTYWTVPASAEGDADRPTDRLKFVDLEAFRRQELLRHCKEQESCDRFTYSNVVIGAEVTLKTTCQMKTGYASQFLVNGSCSSGTFVTLDRLVLESIALLPQSYGTIQEITWLVSKSNFCHPINGGSDDNDELHQLQTEVDRCLTYLKSLKKIKTLKKSFFFIDFLPDFIGTRFCSNTQGCRLCFHLDPFRSQQITIPTYGKVFQANFCGDCTTASTCYMHECTLCGVIYVGGSRLILYKRYLQHSNENQSSIILLHSHRCSGDFGIMRILDISQNSATLLLSELRWHRILQSDWPDNLCQDFCPSLVHLHKGRTAVPKILIEEVTNKSFQGCSSGGSLLLVKASIIRATLEQRGVAMMVVNITSYDNALMLLGELTRCPGLRSGSSSTAWIDDVCNLVSDCSITPEAAYNESLTSFLKIRQRLQVFLNL